MLSKMVRKNVDFQSVWPFRQGGEQQLRRCTAACVLQPLASVLLATSYPMSLDNTKPLVGSCHKFSDGYGLFLFVHALVES